jgi:hypothetical protein
MTTMDLTQQMAPVLWGVIAMMLMSAAVIASEALRTGAALPVRSNRMIAAAAVMVTVFLLMATALVRETLAL